MESLLIHLTSLLALINDPGTLQLTISVAVMFGLRIAIVADTELKVMFPLWHSALLAVASLPLFLGMMTLIILVVTSWIDPVGFVSIMEEANAGKI